LDIALEPFAVPLILIGILLIIGMLLQASLRRTAVPPIVVYLGLGVAVAFVEWRWGWIGESGRGAVEFLGSVGIVFLLFRVGLESDVRKLAENLRGASAVWILDVAVSGGLGFVVAHHVLELELVASLFVATAMTATSVGISVAVWREQGALDSKRGRLLLDVAELDDVSGILLMALLLAVAAMLHDGDTGALALSVGSTLAKVLGRLAVFGLAVAAFARFAEAPLTRLIARRETAPDRLITVVGVGLVVAAVAGALGFSLAIGAFFAGLAFSRDPEAVKLDAYFDPLYDFFTPFFFIAIGLRVDPEGLEAAIPLGTALFLVAAAGKVLGAGGGSLLVLKPRDAALLGVSMMPRAEIALVIMQYGVLLGPWAVSPPLFSAMVVVSLLTSLAGPIGIRSQLRRAAG
jgi:Kef-type K+ transport system membrane component KefB